MIAKPGQRGRREADPATVTLSCILDGLREEFFAKAR